ncbi:alcohol-forming fatty acyl-CoA reductase-like [Phalaenopsis equestris]|uniref:alcohol-forming fatty acyl-CoA reductase-like n=1 Tax=Phalaenopsis equestris TaxID=78828 RepID=UPI0009E3252D|nr:alcohol-forming fatty acyl-CoA reductase-like [Phalaenopsis equestris]
MELGGMVDALIDKSILITGSTGFLAKIFVEKVLRVQPKVKRLYLLVRASDAKSAQERLQNEVIEKELFDILRKEHGKEFNSFMAEKVCAVPGDIIHHNLGIEDINMRELLWKNVNMVIHVAATTNFYVRYDIALDINVLGAKHTMNFAKKCSKLEVFLHVSTAYVTGEKEGVLLEKAFSMGEALKGNMYLDIESELELVERRKKELRSGNTTMGAEKMAMKELGIERARHYGWPNTYVFTKAMGEMMVGKLRGNMPLVIARPTIITSTWKEPFPGWIEGNRTIDNIIVGYAKGTLPCFVADINSRMDVIPGDMVANAMIAMVVAHSNKQGEFIYHISSSVRNPVNYSILEQCGYRYFSKNPQIGKNGKEIRLRKLPIFKKLAFFRIFLFLRYWLPLEMLRLVNIIFCCMFLKKYNELSRKYKFLMFLIDLYIPYCFFKGCFDDFNLERLRMATKKHAENQIFYFDPEKIDWDEYFYSIHIPGVIKYACN